MCPNDASRKGGRLGCGDIAGRTHSRPTDCRVVAPVTDRKPRISLLPYRGLTHAAFAKEYGDKKYGGPQIDNEDPDAHIDSAIRHLLRHREELRDSESGELHLGHAAMQVMIAIDLLGCAHDD